LGRDQILDQLLKFIELACQELILFSAIGFLIGGIDELIIDMIWIVRQLWRKWFIYPHFTRATSTTIASAYTPGHLAIFVPAWDESTVIAEMLAAATSRYKGAEYTIFVGCYPNDQATILAVKSVTHPRIRLILCDKDGPTTKADCLNALWHALLSDQLCNKMHYKAVVLHDAEDLVSPDELVIFDRLIEKNALVQLPVIPIVDHESRWISGHYCDEFAEAHCKTLVVREFLGAGVPAAGVGCAISCAALARLAIERGGDPFDVDSLTEDYELGLRLRALGEKTIFVRLPQHGEAGVTGTRAHFPATLETAVRQKTRWITGIALAGWDRLGWSRGIFECWMRLRDRRAVIAAVILTAAYAAAIFALFLTLAGWFTNNEPTIMTGQVEILVGINVMLLFWRMGMRAYFVTHLYGWREGIISIPRTVVGNVIAIMAARRAVTQYWRIAKGQTLIWDKTAHKFPITKNLP
jgi:bacteriophage N4 adsorption protein B